MTPRNRAESEKPVFVPGGAVPQDVEELLALAAQFERMGVDAKVANPNAAINRAKVLFQAAVNLEASGQSAG